MPRYFFHLHNGQVSRDEEGRELPGLAEARLEAIAAARELLCEDLRTGRLFLSHHIDIHGAEGEELLRVRFDEAVSVEY